MFLTVVAGIVACGAIGLNDLLAVLILCLQHVVGQDFARGVEVLVPDHTPDGAIMTLDIVVDFTRGQHEVAKRRVIEIDSHSLNDL